MKHTSPFAFAHPTHQGRQGLDVACTLQLRGSVPVSERCELCGPSSATPELCAIHLFNLLLSKACIFHKFGSVGPPAAKCEPRSWPGTESTVIQAAWSEMNLAHQRTTPDRLSVSRRPDEKGFKESARSLRASRRAVSIILICSGATDLRPVRAPQAKGNVRNSLLAAGSCARRARCL